MSCLVCSGPHAAGSNHTLRVCFARDRLASTRSAAATVAAAAVEAAQSMQQYSNWEPKTFEEDRAEVAVEQSQAASAEVRAFLSRGSVSSEAAVLMTT